MEWAIPERWAQRIGSWGPHKVRAAFGLGTVLMLSLIVWNVTERSARAQTEADATLLVSRIDAQAREIARREVLQKQTAAELTGAQTTREAANRKAGALQAELEMTTANLQAERARLEEQATELLGRIATLERRNRNLGEILSSVLDGAKELEAALQGEREDAQAAQASAHAALERERRQAEGARKEVDRQAKRLAAEAKTAKELAGKAEQAEATAQAIASENQRLARNLEMAVRDRQREAVQREQSEQALSNAYAAVQAREHENRHLKHENGKLAAQVAGYVRENEMLRRKLDDALRNGSRQQKTIEDLQAEVERLQRELAAAKRERKPGIPKND